MSGETIGALRVLPMKEIWYTAVESFSPSHNGWREYIEWANLPQLTEVIGLDAILCPSVVSELSKEDWEHVVTEDYLLDYFRDREYLEKRTGDVADKHILAVVLEPESEQRNRPIPSGDFIGYDLVERQTGISALTNCQGFPDSIDNEELNQYGLLSDYKRARQVQQALLDNHPNEPHADTDLWAVWKLKDGA